MTTVEMEIRALEERLRLAELGPDPVFFEEVLADDAIIVSGGEAALAKPKVIEAHRAGGGPKFTRVEMSELKIFDHGIAAVVTCQGTYEGPQINVKLKFMRVWLKKDTGWQIVAGSVSS
ncbi:MAG: nuclear transport factor 2 family protein [Acidobacteria bacterium]|nr:nuclear transport factor 2 family protein [Acidobacteriota bacterium]